MPSQTVWHGTHHESLELLTAIEHNCTCEFGLMGVRLNACTAHRMLAEDQRALDGLLFGRRMAERLLYEEFSPAATSEPRQSMMLMSPDLRD